MGADGAQSRRHIRESVEYHGVGHIEGEGSGTEAKYEVGSTWQDLTEKLKLGMAGSISVYMVEVNSRCGACWFISWEW